MAMSDCMYPAVCTKDEASTAHAHKSFVPVAKGFNWLSATFVIGILLLTGIHVWVTPPTGTILMCATAWAVLCCFAMYWLVFNQEHPESSAAIMAEDAAPLQVPSSGGEGKSACVVGGGVSGLALARNFLQAGFTRVVLLEGRHKVGGNNEPYFDNKEEHATTCVFTSPSQQPHYADLCRELGVEQTSHELGSVDGAVVLNGRSIAVKMGGNTRFTRFLILAFWQLTWRELTDGLTILALLYYQYKLQPESDRSIEGLLGTRLATSGVFRDFYMGWVGVNIWCRFENLDAFPAHSFATFVFDYACPLVYHNDRDTRDACVLDGRLIRALEDANTACKPRYEQHLNTSVVAIRRAQTTGKKVVTARRCLRPPIMPVEGGADSPAEVIAALATTPTTAEVVRNASVAGENHDGAASTATGRGDGELCTFECDVVVLATQPRAALAILAASAAAATPTEDAQRLVAPHVPPALPAELAKWTEMECFTILHADHASVQSKGHGWVHETLSNQESGEPYAHYAIHPRMGDAGAKYWISYVYGREHARDFLAHHVDATKVVCVLTPTLPVFTCENAAGRNRTWRQLDRECSDVYWTQCCRSGLQFHNNGILSAKRVVSAILGEAW